MDTSISYVSHGTLGWSKEKDPSRGTHVVLSREFYSYLDGQQLTIENLKRDLNWYKNERGQYQPTIDELRAEIRGLQAEVTKQRRIADDALNKFSLESRWNEDVYRIQVERSNAARGLTPKKEHSGYCILSDNQLERRYGDEMERMWEMTIQTPFPCEWPYEKARDLTVQDLLGGFPKPTTSSSEPHYGKCTGFLNSCGVTRTISLEDKEWYHKRVFNLQKKASGAYDYSETIPLPENEDIVYEFSMRRDFRQGYWLAVACHVHPLKDVPAQMLPSRKETKKETKKPSKK